MNIFRTFFKVMIRGYQLLISPVLPKSCRHYPTCSTYTIEAIGLHGILRGGAMAARRIATCHPWADGNFDPVPGSALDHEARAKTNHTDTGTTPNLNVTAANQ